MSISADAHPGATDRSLALHAMTFSTSIISFPPTAPAVPLDRGRVAGKQDAPFSREPRISSSWPPQPIYLGRAHIVVAGLADDEQHVACGHTHRLLHARILQLDGRLDAPRDASAVALEERQHVVDAVHRAAEEHAAAVGAERRYGAYIRVRHVAVFVVAAE